MACKLNPPAPGNFATRPAMVKASHIHASAWAWSGVKLMVGPVGVARDYSVINFRERILWIEHVHGWEDLRSMEGQRGRRKRDALLQLWVSE